MDVQPSNGLDIYLDMTATAPDVILSSGATIDTDTTIIRDSDGTVITVPTALLVAPPNGVDVRVFMVGSLTIEDVTVTGSAALAIVANADIVLRGRLDVAAEEITDAPGAMQDDPGCKGETGVAEATTGQPGSGGGGFATAGGKGGDVINKSGAAGGGVSGTETLIPLRGGCRGGGAGNQTEGGAGGALQLVSRTSILIETDAWIDAGGA